MNVTPSIITQILTDAGQLASGALIYFYESKTNVPKTVYMDCDGNTAWTNPVVCDAYGRATIFGQGVYSVMITAADGTSIMDKVDGIDFGGGSGIEDTLVILPNYAAVRALTTTPKQVYVQGRASAGDGGQGLFSVVSSGSDDDGTTLAANSGATYYQRIYDEVLDPRWFGVVYSRSNDQTTYLNSALAASRATGNAVYIEGSVTVSQDITVQDGAWIKFGEAGSLNGSVSVKFKFLTGSKLEGSTGCIGANVNLTANVGCCDYINPNWFVGSDTYKLSAAADSVSASSLTLGSLTGAGWGEGSSNTEYHHAPGDSTFGVLSVNNMVSAKRYLVNFDVARETLVEYICSNNVTSTGWDGSWLTGYTHRSANGGNTNVLSITTTAKIDSTHAYAFSATISGMSKGSVQIVLGTTTIGTYSVNGPVSSNITFSADNPNISFAPSADFDGTLTGISLTKSSALLSDAIQQMVLTNDGWTGSKTALTHTAGNTSPATFTLNNALPVGTRINGSFSITRSSIQPELIGNAVWSSLGWTGSLATAAYCNRFYYDDNNNVQYVANGQPAPTDRDVYTQNYNSISHVDIHNDNSGMIGGLDNANTYTVTFTVASMTEGGIEIGVNGARNTYYANGTYTFNVKPINNTVTVTAAGACLRGNAGNGYIGTQRAFNGTVQASVKVANPGNVVVSADGAVVVLNNDPAKLAKDVGLYSFNVITTGVATNTLVLTPTTDFDGTISNLTYTIEYPGICDIYAGGYTTGHRITKDGHYSVIFTGSATANNVTFRPSTSFYGNISNISIVEDSAVMPIKLTDIYNVDSNVNMPYLDPWGGMIIFNSAATLTLSGIINNRVLPYIGGAEFLTSVNLGSAMAYPEHAGAIGYGTSDDYAGIKYAFLSGQATLSGVYEVDTNITVANDVILSGPNGDNPSITGQGRIVVGQGVTISTGYQYLDGVVIQLLGAMSCSGLNIGRSYINTALTGSYTVNGTLTASACTFDLWNGISNTGIANIKSVDVSSSNTVTYITPIRNLTMARSCTFTGCGGITTAAVAKVSDCDFNSPKSIGLIVPAGGVLTVNRCFKACALFISSGAGSTSYVYGTPSYDRCQSTSSMLSYTEDTSLLHDGVGAIITDETPCRSTNPLLPRTQMGASTYGTYPFSVISDLVMTSNKWVYGPRMPNYVSPSDTMLPDPVTNDLWSATGSGVLVNAPNDDEDRSAYYEWPYLPSYQTYPGDGFDISRLTWGNVVTLKIDPPSGGFVKGSSIKLFDGYRYYQFDPSGYNQLNSGYSQDVYTVRNRVVDLPIGGTSSINVVLPAITGLACGQPAMFFYGNSDYQGTDSKAVAVGRHAYGTPFGITIINLHGATITCTMSLRLPDDNSVDMFAHTVTERKAFSLLSVNSSSQLNNHVSTWDIINSRIIRTNQLGLETNMVNNGAMGSVIKSNWNIAHYNWNMNDNSDAGFAWINMTNGASTKHEIRHN